MELNVGDLTGFLESGILEMYVMELTSAEENDQVIQMAVAHQEVRDELDAIQIAMEQYAAVSAKPPAPTVKPFLMATIDYIERMKGGEAPTFPPLVSDHSSIADYEQWLDRPDMVPAVPLDEIDARIIGYTPEMITAIIWIKNGAPPEVHEKEYETFLIIEGSCNIVVAGEDNHLKPGNVFAIPLHLPHTVIVTSGYPCKIILQRRAA